MSISNIPIKTSVEFGPGAGGSDVVEVRETYTPDVTGLDELPGEHPLVSVAEQVIPHLKGISQHGPNSHKFAAYLGNRTGFFVASSSLRPDQILAFGSMQTMDEESGGRLRHVIDQFDITWRRPLGESSQNQRRQRPPEHYLRTARALLLGMFDGLDRGSVVGVLDYAGDPRDWFFREHGWEEPKQRRFRRQASWGSGQSMLVGLAGHVKQQLVK